MLSRLIASFALIAALSPAAGLAAERPVVVELFTSQGCSSCPPANAYLNELSKQRRDVLALAFHVTYWDRLGWRDPFSLEAATRRQAVYGRRFGDGSYTPEMVVDGAASMVGSARGQVGAAIENARRNGRSSAAVNLTRNGEQVSIEVGAGSGSGNILLVGFDHEHTTAIARGENSGRTLVEANVVRSMRSVGQWSGSALRISERFPEGQDVAVLVEAPDGRIIGACRLNGGGSI
ncbi:MAG TPA: DUF1223 domain-containing protein [Bradyrhizobium sp.]|nr:DUF1223 domain-containing protein [Bradyrhizobium sp.]